MDDTQKRASGTIKLKGKIAGQPYERSITINLPEVEAANDVLATLWARTRIDDLSNARLKAETAAKGTEIDNAITGLGLEFRLLTQFTSFVAVEDKVVNQNGSPMTVQVPVEIPAGMAGTPSVDGQSATSGANGSAFFSNIPVSRTIQGLYTVAPVSTRSGLRQATGRDRKAKLPARTISGGVVSGQGSGMGIGSGSGGGGGGGMSATVDVSAGAMPPPPPPKAMSSDELRNQRLKSKLHNWLYEWVARLSAKDAKPTANEALFVTNGMASIRIQLSTRSPKVLEKLRAAGFELVSTVGRSEVTGTIRPEDLAALADIGEVKLVLPKI